MGWGCILRLVIALLSPVPDRPSFHWKSFTGWYLGSPTPLSMTSTSGTDGVPNRSVAVRQGLYTHAPGPGAVRCTSPGAKPGPGSGSPANGEGARPRAAPSPGRSKHHSAVRPWASELPVRQGAGQASRIAGYQIGGARAVPGQALANALARVYGSSGRCPPPKRLFKADSRGPTATSSRPAPCLWTRKMVPANRPDLSPRPPY